MIRLALLALAFALGTYVAGWVSVPLVAVAWAMIAGRDRAPLDAVLSVVLAWCGLLGLATLAGPTAEVARVIGSVVGVPSWVPVAATLIFGAALAWSAAVVGREIARRVRPRAALP